MSGLLIVFALSIDDFVVTSYLAKGADTETVPIKLYSAARGAPTPALNALASIMVAITLARLGARLPRVQAARARHGRLGARVHWRDLDEHERGIAAGRIEIVSLTKRFGDVAAVDDISLDIAGGEFFSMVGPSGCGKTTTLRMIAGFERPDEGEIRLDGVDMSATPPHKRNVNTVFQSYALFPHLRWPRTSRSA